jgi:hypothetical protein
MSISAADTEILRHLAAEVAEIAALPVQQQTIANWKTLNSLKRAKPMVLAYDIPWQELNVNDELTLRTTDEFARGLETNLQRMLYQWRHFRGDMVVEDVVYCPLAIRETGFGIQEQVEIVETDATSAVVSRDFTPQIDNEEDVLKIKFPEVSHDVAATEATFSAMSEIFDGLLRVEKRGWIWGGIVSWDELIRWWDVQKAMLDLVLRPELVHLALERLTAANVHRLEQLEAQGLLALNANYICGSGGYGYTDELPAPGFDPARVRTIDMWGSATSQIFSEVSPAMHEEFALRYERPWVERFGLSYYGCCEQLHHKVDILRSIKNLRKISMSAWADAQRGSEALGTDYVFSHKPNPAIVAEHSWRPELARQRYRDILEITRGNVVEIILKDISTVRYEPQRLWDWTRFASEEAENFAS